MDLTLCEHSKSLAINDLLYLIESVVPFGPLFCLQETRERPGLVIKVKGKQLDFVCRLNVRTIVSKCKQILLLKGIVK